MTVLEDIRAGLKHVARGDQPGQVEARFRFDEGAAFFAGHFPGRPLLPGIFQIGLVQEAAAASAGVRYDLVQVVKAKFTDEVRPGETITLRATLSQGETPRINATLWNPRGLAGKVSLVLRDRAARAPAPGNGP